MIHIATYRLDKFIRNLSTYKLPRSSRIPGARFSYSLVKQKLTLVLVMPKLYSSTINGQIAMHLIIN